MKIIIKTWTMTTLTMCDLREHTELSDWHVKLYIVQLHHESLLLSGSGSSQSGYYVQSTESVK